MWITICGDKTIYPGDLATSTASLKILKIVLNSVISHHGAKFICFDVKIYIIKISNILSEFIEEYNLKYFAFD